MREELGAEETVIEKLQRIKTYMVWTRGEDGRKKTTTCSM